MNDNELVILANENNEEAEKKLLIKYENVVKLYVNNNLSYGKASGLDEKDLYQEGLLGLTYAIKNFKAEKNVTFYTFACICIDTNIRSSIRTSNRYKFKLLNESVSLDELFEEADISLYDILKDEKSDPSKQVIDKENSDFIFKELKKTLTDFEKKVLKLKSEGFDNKEIAVILKKEKRSIENTITRIRTKYKGIKKENN